MSEKVLGLYTDDYDTVVAYDPDDARKVLTEQIGMQVDGDTEYRRIADDALTGFSYDPRDGDWEYGVPEGAYRSVSKSGIISWSAPASAWLQLLPRGFWVSTEW